MTAAGGSGASRVLRDGLLRLTHRALDLRDRLSRVGVRKPAFVIIGTGRCGTNFVADYLTAAGHPCGHERFYRPTGPVYSPGQTQTTREGDSSWLAVPFLPEAGVRVVHQTRAPVAVIASFLKLGFFHEEHYSRHKRFVDFARRHFDFSDDPTRSAARWYIEWNEKCAAITDRQFRLEDFRNRIDRLGDWLGLDAPLPTLDLPVDTNTKTARVDVLEDDLRERLRRLPEFPKLVDLSYRLGYDFE